MSSPLPPGGLPSSVPTCGGKGHVGKARDSSMSLCFLFAVGLETEDKSSPVLAFAGPTCALAAGLSPLTTCGSFAGNHQDHLPLVFSTCCPQHLPGVTSMCWLSMQWASRLFWQSHLGLEGRAIPSRWEVCPPLQLCETFFLTSALMLCCTEKQAQTSLQ